MWARDTGDAHGFHIGSWGLWLGAAMLAALGTRNPFYLGLTMCVALLVLRVVGSAQGEAGGRGGAVGAAGFWRIVVALTLIVALLKGLSYHLGETLLFELPGWLPVIGGRITLEGMVAAWLDALALLCVLSVFAAFSAGADYYALLRSVPGAMQSAGLVTSIAITFVPQTVERWREIREAQALRGHRVRRVGDLLPLIMPLLAGGMERSMNLAEAMEARGFGRRGMGARRAPTPLLVQSGLAGGLGLLLAGGAMFAFLPASPWVGWLLMVLGGALLGLTLWAVGMGSARTRYRRSVWRAHDTPMAIVSAGALAALLVFKLLAPSLLAYTPFLRISLPTFDPVVAVALVALVAPAVLKRTGRRPASDA